MNRERVIAVWLPAFCLVSFFLHLAWENWQVVFYRIGDAPHATAVWVCTRAAFGDATIALFAFLFGALWERSWLWALAPGGRALLVYLSWGLGVTLATEYLATEVWHRWAYSTRMPVLPVFDAGLLPVLQWILLPPVCLLVSRWIFRGFVGERAPIPLENKAEGD